MNLTKFNLLHMQLDDSIDHTDFPAIWNLNARMQASRSWPEQDYARTADLNKLGIPPDRLMLMNLAGDTTSIRSVLIDSALGLQAQKQRVLPRAHGGHRGLAARAAAAQVPGGSDRGGTGPDPCGARDLRRAAARPATRPARTIAWARSSRSRRSGPTMSAPKSWSRVAADGTNAIVAQLGIQRTPMSKPDRIGYIAVPLHGLWLRAPYLHNGSVPTVAALLQPAACRPTGVLPGIRSARHRSTWASSRTRCGAPPAGAAGACPAMPVQSGCMPAGAGWRFETSDRGNSNAGHSTARSCRPLTSGR